MMLRATEPLRTRHGEQEDHQRLGKTQEYTRPRSFPFEAPEAPNTTPAHHHDEGMHHMKGLRGRIGRDHGALSVRPDPRRPPW